jgi:hypothetical protein
MGTEIRCKECNQVLAEFDEVPTDVIGYSRLVYKLKGECPKCGHKLPDVSVYAEKLQFKVQSRMPILVR